MSLRKTSGRLVALALFAAAALAVPGCGGGYHSHWHDAGTLEVINADDSFWGIDTVEVSTFFGPTESFDVFLAPGEGWDVDLDPDEYEIRLLWSNGDEFVYYESIDDDETTTIVAYD
jgi:hypothetical protein